MRNISESIRDESRGRGNADGPFSSQPPWAVAIWPIFRVAHSLRINSDMLVVRALKIGQMTDGGMPPTYDSMH